MRNFHRSGGAAYQSARDPLEEAGFLVGQAIRFLEAMLALAYLPDSLVERRDRMSNIGSADVQTVVVEIGGIPIQLCGEPAFLDMAKDRYIGFLSSDCRPRIDLRVDVVSRANFHQEDVRVVRQAGLWSAERGDFRLDWDSNRSSGRLQVELHAYSLDTALRILHTILLAEQGGFLLHAASAVRGGRAFLFFGPSGSGKTTLSRFAPPDVVLLTDEISYVRRANDEYLAFGTPFTGELAKSGENVSAPVGALFHLVKAQANRLVPINVADAARAILGSVLFFAEDPNLVTSVFQSVCKLVCQLPIYRLEFVPDQSVWGLIQ
jgi:hypothetical protein